HLAPPDLHSFPTRRSSDLKLTLSRSGASSVVVNGRSFNFSTVPNGAELPVEAIDSPWFAGPVTRVDGELRLCLILPVGANASPEDRKSTRLNSSHVKISYA